MPKFAANLTMMFTERPFPERFAAAAAALAPLYVQYAQLSGLRCALDAGISPDNPSPDGSVNRVVKGVTDYPYPV